MLLTDEEIIAAGYNSGDPDGLLEFGKNVIAAYEAKLREQEPVCWITPDGEGWRMRLDPPVNNVPLGWQPLFEHPAPIPEGWRCPVCNTGLKHEHTYNCVAKLREQEPVAWMYQHEDTGLVGFIDQYQLDNGFEKLNPRLQVTTPLFEHPAPIPEDHALVPIDPEGQWSNDDLINIMVDAYQDSNGGYYDSMLAAYKAMLAATRSKG